jgi:hypothetical protein
MSSLTLGCKASRAQLNAAFTSLGVAFLSSCSLLPQTLIICFATQCIVLDIILAPSDFLGNIGYFNRQ